MLATDTDCLSALTRNQVRLVNAANDKIPTEFEKYIQGVHVQDQPRKLIPRYLSNLCRRSHGNSRQFGPESCCLAQAKDWLKKLLVGLPLAIILSWAVASQGQTIYQPYAITTLAGIPPGSVDANGIAARFDSPFGAAADSAGNLYIADTYNQTIRKITDPAGLATVTTFAGLAGEEGSSDGTDSARFSDPREVAIDASGNVYVADAGNDTIRKITPDGLVSTLAGLAGFPGSDDGVGSQARFHLPTGITLDAAGNLYVGDTLNNTIRKITPAGVVSTLAGLAGEAGSADGVGNQARFDNPRGVAVDNMGNVFVADSKNHTVRKITPDAVVTTFAGTADNPGHQDGTGAEASFDFPFGATVDSANNIYVTETQNRTIRKITPDQVVTTIAGDATAPPGSMDGTGSGALFDHPRSVTADPAGVLYVADTDNDTIRKIVINPDGLGDVVTIAGIAGQGSADGLGAGAQFDHPLGVARDISGNLYISDVFNNTIRKVTFTEDGEASVTTLAGDPDAPPENKDGTGSEAHFNLPRGITVDDNGVIYVGDWENDTIRRITPEAVVTTIVGQPATEGCTNGNGTTEALLNHPNGVAVTPAGDILYIADNQNHDIRKVTFNEAGEANVEPFAGECGVSGSSDGTGAEAHFNQPGLMALDGAGNLYVGDTLNHTIRKVTPDAVVTTIAGLALTPGSTDGAGADARFNFPRGVAVDESGQNIYVGDRFNNTIRKITIAPDGSANVVTLAGLPGRYASFDGAGDHARFHQPAGLLVDSTGRLYLIDQTNNTLRSGVPAPPVITSPLSPTIVHAVVGQPFTYQFIAAGAAQLAVTDLPPGLGLSFDPAIFAIVGTPTIPGSFQISLQATNDIGTTSGTLALQVDSPSDTGVTVVNAAAVTGAIGGSRAPFRYQVRAEGLSLAATYSAQGLPAGLTIDPVTGLISGELPSEVVYDAELDEYTELPAQDATSLVMVTIRDGELMTTAPLQLAFTSNPAVPVITSASEGVLTQGESFFYQIEAPSSADQQTDPTLFNLIGHLPLGLTFDKDAGTISGVFQGFGSRGPTQSGGIITSDEFFGSNGNGSGTTTFTFTAKPFITSPLDEGIKEGESFNYQITANYDPTSFDATPLPPGLSINAATGVISGKPTASCGTFPITISASNPFGTTSKTLVLTVVPQAPKVISPLSFNGYVGNFLTYQIVGSSCPTGYDAMPAPPDLSFPPGLSIDRATGLITGTPTVTGTFHVLLTVNNDSGTGTAILTLTVSLPSDSSITIISGTSVTARAGQFFSYQIRATGLGPAATATADTLPSGLSLDAKTGVISGTPTQAGSSVVVLTVHDGVKTTSSSLQLTFTSDPDLPVIISAPETFVTPGATFSYRIAAPISGVDPVVFAIVGTPPLGLNFNAATGEISGRFSGTVEDLLGIVQLSATNSHGSATILLSFLLQPPGARNISTRLAVGADDNVLIGGFIVTGEGSKRILVRAIGPSLADLDPPVPGALLDPVLELHYADGTVVANNDWTETQETEIEATGIPPGDERESAIIVTLPPLDGDIPGSGVYTAVVRGNARSTGIALVEVYDLGTASLNIANVSHLANISTRGKVASGDNVMIGGFIVGGTGPSDFLFRAIGPSLGQTTPPVIDALQDPTLEIFDANAGLVASNDNWQASQKDEIMATGIPPADPRESALVTTLAPGSYTAIVRSVSDTSGGVALVEGYVLK